MPPTTVESQFAFLISCIRYSNNGKVDFGEVAKECSIISKAAAAKRYERLMKANGLHQSSPSTRDTTVASRPRKNAPESTGKGKKRTFAEYENSSNTGDDDEELLKGKTKLKEEAVKEEADGAVEIKEEEKDAIPQLDGASDGLFHKMLPRSQLAHYEEDDKSMFSDFLKSGMMEDQYENKHTVFGPVEYGEYPLGSVGSYAGSCEAMADSIVITD